MNTPWSQRPVRAAGERPTVIALHAGIGSPQEWRPLGERLRFRYRVLAPDLYGYATRRDTPLSLDAEAVLIEPLIDALRGPVYLVGHDYGAAVALKLAQRRRERIAGLVLFEPAAFGLLLADPTSRHDTLEMFVLRRVLARYLDAGDWFGAALRYVDHWSGADAWERLSTPQRATIASRMPELWARLDAALSDPTPLSGYARIDVPVLLLTSAWGLVSAARIAQLLAGTLARTEWHKVNGAGLGGIDSHPEAVEREIEDFLARHQASWHRDPEPTLVFGRPVFRCRQDALECAKAAVRPWVHWDSTVSVARTASGSRGSRPVTSRASR